jgi:histidine triad (HIT) family protein
MTEPACIFCQIVAGQAEASFVYRDEVCSAFMDIQPVNAGHLLIVPNAHAVGLADLPPETGAHMLNLAQCLAGALRGAAGEPGGPRCEGVDLFLADGEAAGQEVFHAHLHVIPRFAGDGFGFVFPPGYHDLPPRAELDRLAEAIRRGQGQQ